jgi:hypothetical protein
VLHGDEELRKIFGDMSNQEIVANQEIQTFREEMLETLL